MNHAFTFTSSHRGRALAFSITLLAAATLSACGGIPQGNDQLDQARRDVRDVRNDPRAQGYAGDDLQRARDALARANAAWNDSASEAQIDHLSYLASQRAAIVRANLNTRVAQDTLDAAEARRRRVQLDARTQQADTAQRDAAQAQRQTQAALERNRQLAARLEALNARPTPRGLVVTLGDVLFDVDRAALRPGGQRLVQQLATVLNEFPQRNALIEGHTDSTGSDAHNQALSNQRAQAVRSALLQQGIAGARISARGYGESRPVSDNNTAGGRQMNRRVEIVLSDDNGQLSAR